VNFAEVSIVRNVGVAHLCVSVQVRVTQRGALVFRSVTPADAGRYSCTPYSQLGEGRPSVPVQLIVKGLTVVWLCRGSFEMYLYLANAVKCTSFYTAASPSPHRHTPSRYESLYFTRMNISGSKTNGNNKLTNLAINISSQHIQHDEVGDT